MRVALVHYWLVGVRGGEKVLEELCLLFPEADIFTLVCNEDKLSEVLRSHRIVTSWLQQLPFAVHNYKMLLPLMPFALEHFDLREYDLVISSEAGPAKGVIVRPEAVHVCYCHSPLRYIWDKYHDYRSGAGLVARLAMPLLAPPLRVWDVTTAARVDHFVANSAYVAQRIERYFRRDAQVVHPPVETEAFGISDRQDDFYLFAGQLVRYKRADLAVEAFNRLDRPLVVIGEGEQLGHLRKIARGNVTFLGRQPFDVLRTHYQRCRALIFPGEEDFGIVPVEAMACGRPVIAFGRGGALETVFDGVTGVLFREQSTEALVQAVERFEAMRDRFSPEVIRYHACRFDRAIFRDRMGRLVAGMVENRRSGGRLGYSDQYDVGDAAAALAFGGHGAGGAVVEPPARTGFAGAADGTFDGWLRPMPALPEVPRAPSISERHPA